MGVHNFILTKKLCFIWERGLKKLVCEQRKKKINEIYFIYQTDNNKFKIKKQKQSL